MDSRDLQKFLVGESIAAEIVHLANETPTVEAAASAVGCQPEQIGKSLLFLADGNPHLVIANGTTRVGYKPLASYLGVSRRRLRLANAAQVLATTGYTVGTVPPFGHITKLRTILEAGVMTQQELFAGGGANQTLLRIEVRELVRATAAQIISLPA